MWVNVCQLFYLLNFHNIFQFLQRVGWVSALNLFLFFFQPFSIRPHSSRWWHSLHVELSRVGGEVLQKPFSPPIEQSTPNSADAALGTKRASKLILEYIKAFMPSFGSSQPSV